MAPPPKHSVSVAGVVVDDQGRVLVIRRDDTGHWQPPGGVLELDETFEEGVRREVLEETGITVVVERLTGVYKNVNHGIVALVFRCCPVAGTAHPTEEAAEVRWADRGEIETLMAPAFSVRIMDAFGGEVCARAHDGVNLIGLEPR